MTHLRDVLINANLALLSVGNVLKALRFELSVLDAAADKQPDTPEQDDPNMTTVATAKPIASI